MAISQFSAGPLRRRIAFSRTLPPETTRIFKERGYECYLLEAAKLEEPDEIATTDSVVLTQTLENPQDIRKDLQRLAHVLDHGCCLYVRYVPSPSAQEIILKALNTFFLPPSGFATEDVKFFDKSWFEGAHSPVFAPFVHILIANDDWHSLANLIASNPAGIPPNPELTIDISDASHQKVVLSEDQELLLRRAFWKCTSVKLLGKANGLSGVGTYEAFADITGNVVGSGWPYRYFVKLGSRLKIAREYEKYRMTALQNVPYHLGPRLRLDRCVLGRSQGVIVSDYVSGAEVLRDCARDGRGIPAISNLFNVTLLPWRRAAREEGRPLQETLLELLERKVPEHRQSLITTCGATKTLDELKSIFRSASPSQPVLTGVIHNDLHATNVLVRMNDAVIIDLESIQNSGPLLIDAASLEGGLFVDGFIKDRRCAADILLSLQSLYDLAAFERDDHHCHPVDGSAWFIDSVRQIRMQARQMERQTYQYAWTLAYVLLRKACNTEDFREDAEVSTLDSRPLTRETCRALAYVVAERILIALSKQGEQPPK